MAAIMEGKQSGISDAFLLLQGQGVRDDLIPGAMEDTGRYFNAAQIFPQVFIPQGVSRLNRSNPGGA